VRPAAQDSRGLLGTKAWAVLPELQVGQVCQGKRVQLVQVDLLELVERRD